MYQLNIQLVFMQLRIPFKADLIYSDGLHRRPASELGDGAPTQADGQKAA